VLGEREYLMWQDNGDGLGALWQVTTKAIYRALPAMGQGNLEEIADRVREGVIKVD
jgi:hypothetical protein